MPTITEREAEMFERFRTEIMATNNYPAKMGDGPYIDKGNARVGTPDMNSSAYFRVDILPAPAVKRELGTGGKVLHTGILSIAINTPENSGEVLMRSLIDAIVPVFSSRNVAGLHYLSPYPTPRIVSSGWAQRTVQCPYRYFV